MRRGFRGGYASVLLAGLAICGAQSVLAVGPATATAAPNVNIVPMSAKCSTLFCFKPQGLKVASGTKVTWTNMTGAPHTVTRCTAAACAGHSGGTGGDTGFGSSTLGPSQQYAFTFHGAGTYVYYCAIHGYATMHGKVTVP